MAGFLQYFYSITDTNAMLGRGSMFVFSFSQVIKLVHEFSADIKSGVLLDIGAGNGAITAVLAKLFNEVYTTEVSDPMVQVLNTRGFNCIKTSDLSPIYKEKKSYRMIR